MPIRFGTQYQCKRLDNLGDPEWHNSRWQDIDLRMAARENDATKIDDAVDRMEAVALSRLNDTFSPLIKEAMDQLASVGVSFSGQSFTTNTIGIGVKTFIITEQYRTGMVVVDFVSIRPTGVADTSMICDVTSYDRTTGALVVEAVTGYVTGSGTYSDWQIRVSVTPNLDTYSRGEVDDLFSAVVGHPPASMNTLEKIAGVLGNDPNAFGALLSAALQRTNNLSDVTSTVVARNNLGLGNVNNTSDLNKPVSSAQSAAIAAVQAAVMPVGTQLVFFQAVVPTGWIRNTAHNDKAIRVVSGSGGVAGGVQPFSTAFSRVNVDYHTLDGNELTYHAHGVADPGHAHGLGDPGHAHSLPSVAGTFQDPQGAGGPSVWVVNYPVYGTDAAGTGMWVGGAGVGVGIYAAGANYGHTHGFDNRVQYVDVIIGIKA